MVFDRSSVYVGSMNFDQRSIRFNTEVGLIVQSPELAEQTARRFEAMTQPQSSYSVALQQMEPRDLLLQGYRIRALRQRHRFEASGRLLGK